MSKLETNTIDTVSGTTNLTIGSTNSSTVTFENGAATGHNYPAFSATLNTNQSLTQSTYVKVIYDTEVFDTDSAFDTSTGRFTVPSGKAGKYFFTTFAKINSAGGSATLLGTGMRFTKNGSNIKQAIHFVANGSNTSEGKGVNCVLDLAVNDYIEVYAYYQDNGGGTGSITGSSDFDTFFTGFKLIE